MTTAHCSYSAEDNVWFVDIFAHARFSTARQVADAFAECRRYWKSHINKRCYAIVDYTGTTIDKAAAETFAEERQRIVSEITITTLRFSTDLEARTTIRAMSIKIHQPSNLYASRDEALKVVHHINAGLVTVGSDSH
jgi:hypothetical protein